MNNALDISNLLDDKLSNILAMMSLTEVMVLNLKMVVLLRLKVMMVNGLF
jgi:hypothetical protein